MLTSPNSRLPATPRFLAGVCLALIFCFGGQAYFYFVWDWGTGKGESNYYSTMSRFQAAATPAAEIAFAGSSITGRIPGRELGNQEIANLGSDGGPALDGIRLLVEGKIAPPRWLVIETNTLYGGVGSQESLISRGAQGPWFNVGVKAPLLGASARPSAMLYAKLLRRPKILSGEPFPLNVDGAVPAESSTWVDRSEVEKARAEQYVLSIHQLQQRGVKILFVTYPAGPMTEREELLMRATLVEFSKRFPVSYLDLREQIPRELLEFKDGVHLSAESAARVLSTVQHHLMHQK